MPRLYEEAALLLFFVAGRGVTLNTLFDVREIVAVMAQTLEAVTASAFSDADAAAFILDAFEDRWLGWPEPAKRDRLIALIGTFLGNTPTLRSPPAS